MAVNIRGMTVKYADAQRRMAEDALVEYVKGHACISTAERKELRGLIAAQQKWSSAMRRIRKREEKAAKKPQPQCTCSQIPGERYTSRVNCAIHGAKQ